MSSRSRSTRMWGVMVAGLCVLWFVTPAGAIQLESWDNKIPNANARFKVLSEFGGAAVLDKETGLVWEQSPDTGSSTWFSSRFNCINKNVGGRKGWRLPSVAELATLIDPNAGAPPFLPAGHPFTNVQSARYWSATTDAELPDNAWVVLFGFGEVSRSGKTLSFPAWCVRGGMNADQY